MPTENEFKKMQNVSYAEGLDILLEWGQITLLMQDSDELLQELEGRWVYLRAVNVPLSTGLEVLEGAIETALALLHGAMALETDSTDQMVAALQKLDQAVFLAEALESFPYADHLPADFQAGAQELLRLVTIDRSPPSLRLIPLNNWRQDVLKLIPSHIRYLFPWYAAWADLPANTLEALTDHWQEAVRGRPESLNISPGELNALMAELKHDEPLLKKIEAEARLFQLLPQVVEESVALRLFAVYEEKMAGKSAPDTVRDAGLLIAACQAVDTEFRSEVERTEQLFLAAFCSPFLETRQRLDLFSQVEKFISRCRPSLLRPDSIMEILCLWSRKRLSDSDLAHQAERHWKARLIRAAELTDANAIFSRVVENVRTARTTRFVKKTVGEGFPKPRRTVRRRTIFTLALVLVLAVAALTVYNGPDKGQPIPPQLKQKVVTRKITAAPALHKKEETTHYLTRYRPVPLTDPFQALFRKEEVPAEKGRTESGMQLMPTPLEKADTDTFRLAGIILTPGGRKALVEDDHGRGYVIQKGTAIGIRSGRVTAVLEDRVIIEEKVADESGRMVIRQRVLRFPRENEE